VDCIWCPSGLAEVFRIATRVFESKRQGKRSIDALTNASSA